MCCTSTTCKRCLEEWVKACLQGQRTPSCPGCAVHLDSGDDVVAYIDGVLIVDWEDQKDQEAGVTEKIVVVRADQACQALLPAGQVPVIPYSGIGCN